MPFKPSKEDKQALRKPTGEFVLLDELSTFINERWSIHLKRLKKEPAPWTDDELLRTFRFCNVRRQDDRVSIAVHSWLKPHENDPQIWLAAYMARIFNNPATLAAISWPLPWDAAHRKKLLKELEVRKTQGNVYNAAYICSTHGTPDIDKGEFYCQIFDELWKRRADLRIAPQHGALEGWCRRVTEMKIGVGGFMAGQVLADIKELMPYMTAPDYDTFAVSGPGSRRGMNRMLGLSLTGGWNEHKWHSQLIKLRMELTPLLTRGLKLDCQNLQNCLCEFDKYRRAVEGTGRPKQKFHPSEEKYVRFQR